jgi:two-component system OmpR family response regulator
MKILVIEDEDRMRDLLVRGLTQAGHVVDEAPTGLEGEYMLGESRYDAVVLDWMLPDLSGVEVCRNMRARRDWTPVLMLTARDALEDRVKGLDAGADDYLVKPFGFAELSARLRSVTRRGKPSRPTRLTAGSIVLDPATHEVRVAGKIVDLTPKEFSLLEFLLRRLNQVISRPSIVEHVWDFAYDGASNVVDVYVGYLRKKLGAEGSRIETVRGVGYRFRE